MSEQKVVRYCPGCNARVKADASVFETQQRCPKCGGVVLFVDIPNDPPLGVEEPAEEEPGILDYAGYASLAIGIGAGLLAVPCLLLGMGPAGAFLAFVFAVAGAIPATLYARSQAELLRLRRQREEVDEEIALLRSGLDDATEKWRRFRDNFDNLAGDERNRILKETEKSRRQSEKAFRFAEDRESTIDRLGKRFLSDTTKWVGAKITSQNFSTQRDRLTKAIGFCRKHEYEVARETEASLLKELRDRYEEVLRKEQAKAEQARIKSQIREEQRAERERAKEIARVQSEQAAIQAALGIALRDAADQHSAEVERLREQLLDAEARAERAKSMAQLTRAGHIYVISNVGSFGKGVFKVGMTRRLEPMDRVKELGDASVPFPFDVHMMISCDDAPALENALHRALHRRRVNRVNLRKEYFATDIETIRTVVLENHGEVDYVVDPEALEYHEGLSMSEEDFDFTGTAQSQGIDEWE